MEPSTLKQPIHFGAPDRPLFGFYHPAQGASRATGVVLCSPIGTDQTRSERAFRHLAERLAEVGFAVLRFDPFGTGDSGGDLQAPGLVQSWLQDVGLAAAELRSRSSVETLSLVGLRLGATVALQAAEQLELGSLVLWSPCESGRAFLDEQTKLHRIYLRMEPQLGGVPTQAADSENGVEALGSFYPRALVSELEQLDTARVARVLARRTLVIDGSGHGGGSGLDALVTHLRAAKASPELRSHPGHKFLMSVPHAARVPGEIVESIVDWLSAGHSAEDAAVASASESKSGGSNSGPNGEQPIWFGPRRSLFGILAPADAAQAKPGRPPIVVANAGCVNRAGPHRATVRMARRWAALGFDVLRIDLSGIGDSLPAPGLAENLTYPPGALEDLEAAIAALGGRSAIVAGLCSGGDYAFQMGIHSKNVRGAWMLNPRTFCVLDLTAVESAAGSAPPGTPVADVPRALREMAERGLDPFLVVSRNDPGIAYVDAHAGGEMAHLKSVSGFQRADIDRADHTFTTVASQAQVEALLTDHLLARYSQ